jgi:hypothetical protein
MNIIPTPLFDVKDQVESRNCEQFTDMITGIDDFDFVPGRIETPLDLDEDAKSGTRDVTEVLEIKDRAFGNSVQEFFGLLGFAGDEHTLQVNDSCFILPYFKHTTPFTGQE